MEFMVHIADRTRCPRPGDIFYDLMRKDKIYMRIASPMSYIILDKFHRRDDKYFVAVDLTTGEISFKEYENHLCFLIVDCESPIVFKTKEE